MHYAVVATNSWGAYVLFVIVASVCFFFSLLMDIYANKRKPTAVSLLELLLRKRMGECERQPPKIVITGKTALAHRVRIKKLVSKCSGKKSGNGGTG